MSSIQSKLINLSGNVTGTLPLINGGTGTAAASANAAFNALSPMTTAGDIIYGGTSGAGTRLAAGTTSQVFVGGTTPSWGNTPAAALPLVTQSTRGAVSSAGQLLGTNTNDAAAAGFVGEILVSTVSRVTTGLTSGASFDITSQSVTAGDFECFCQFNVSSADAVSTTKLIAWVSTTSATLPANSTWQNIPFLKISGSAFANDDISLPLSAARISVSTPTTYYFSCQVTWTGALTNQGAWGRFELRRLR